MGRLYTQNVNDATGELAELFAIVKQTLGKVPNAYATIGSNSPALLSQILQTSAFMKQRGSLSQQELEAINLAVSESSGCDYCLAAHTLIGRAAGYTTDQTRRLRAGHYVDDPKLDALVRFALRLVTTTGTLPALAVETVRAAGYTDRQIVDAIGAISAIMLMNMLNRANDTTLDFPQAEAI